MHALITGLRTALIVVGVWSATSVIVAVPLAALFRAQERMDRFCRDLERQRAWREAAR